MKSKVLLLSLVPLAAAQQVAWGQCGGVGWTGATTCVSGYTCQYSNSYYSQCVPGTAGATTTTLRTSTTTSRAGATTTTAAPPASGGGSGSYVTRSGTKFNIDGKVGYFAGTNTYWIGFLTSNADVDTVMAHLKSTGLKVLRVWGFNDATSASGVYYQLFSGGSVTINTGSNGLQRLDYVVSSAEKYGIKLIIPMVNNWDDYGGMNAYAKFYGVSHNDFYTNANIIAQYKKYISAVVSRYKTSKAIFAWELANEARCNGCATSVITNWATTISAYIKSLDSNHLVTLGDEGFMNGGGDGSYPYQPGEGLDWVKNLQISTIDFGTAHLYPGGWGETNAWGNDWIKNHATAAATIGKPFILEEYGVTSDRANVYAQWYSTILANEVAGDMYWQYGDSLSSGQTANDGYTIYYGSSEYNSLVVPHTAKMNAK